MATLVSDLISRVRSVIGDEESSTYAYTDATLRDLKIVQGMERLNQNWPQLYSITGSGSAATFSPDPASAGAVNAPTSWPDVTALVLATALIIAEGEMHKYARTAYTISNPAGRTDLVPLHQALERRIAGLEKSLDQLRAQRAQAGAEQDMSAEELRMTTATTDIPTAFGGMGV